MGKRSEERKQRLAEDYIKSHIARCPICKDRDVVWTFSHKAFLQDRSIGFECSSCHCKLSSSYGDLKGVNGSAFDSFIKGSASYDAMQRSVYGKKKGVHYIKIVEPGNKGVADEYVGREIPLDDLKEMFWDEK